MPGLLGRSRSLRMLRGGHRETHQREDGSHTPSHATQQFDIDRLKAATPAPRAESRVETPEMLQRPKTSSGPGDRGKLFHKKVAPVTLDSENRTYNFPFPAPLNSTVLYAAEVHEVRDVNDDKEDGIIGIALGSPTMASHWNTGTPRSTDFVSSNHGTITEITSQNSYVGSPGSRYEASKPKLSRWKSIFSKRPPPPQEKGSFYQLAHSLTAARADSHHDDDSVDSMSIAKEEQRAAAISREEPRVMAITTDEHRPLAIAKDERRSISPPTYKPDIRESRKTLKEFPPVPNRARAKTLADNASGKPKATIIRTVSSPKVPPKDASSNSPRVPQVVVSGSNASPNSNSGKGLLDVDIPSVHMERYSVMFGSLLQPNNRSSSLLVRRQGAERLKPLTELGMKKDEDAQNGGLKPPQRRATSPSLPKSPSMSLSLFPQPNNRMPSPSRASVHRPRPLQRSKTAPAVSPSRQNFSIPKAPTATIPATTTPTPEPQTKPFPQNAKSVRDSDAGLRTQLLPPTPSSHASSDDDDDDDSEDVVIAVGQPAPWPRFDTKEPQWEILSKKATAPAPPPDLLKLARSPSQTRAPLPNPLAAHSPSTPASAPLLPAPLQIPARAERTPTSPSPAPAPRSADPTTTTASKAAVSVGVARSVSVSRANRPEFLKPALLRAGTEGSEGLERMGEMKPLTPTLVELRNRKSQRVQLVDA